MISSIAIGALSAHSQTGTFYTKRGESPLYTEFYNEHFPFFEATLDLRDPKDPASRLNVVPRAIILPLQHDCFVAFDTELLRVAAIWIGQYPTLKGLAPMSYGIPLNKAGGGIGNLAKPQGQIIYRSQVAPGLRATRSGTETDPRTAFNDPN
ncbi:MAG: hypothetical protein AAGB46_10640, partial [Verrucomicrobiota bacterium]